MYAYLLSSTKRPLSTESIAMAKTSQHIGTHPGG